MHCYTVLNVIAKQDNSDDSRANFCKEQSKNLATFLWTDNIFTL